MLRPGGRLLFLEHVRAGDRRLSRRQDRFNRLNRLVVGCECNRPTLEAIQRAGFVPDRVEHDEIPAAPSFVRPLVIGSAIAPGPVSRADEPVGAAGGRA